MIKNFDNFLIILVLLQTFTVGQGSETCDQRAEKAVNIHKCCSFPAITKMETIKAIVEDLVKTVEPTSTKFHCLFAIKLFEAIKLKDFDKASFKAYIPTMVQDPEWLALYEKSVNHCVDNLPHHEALYNKIMKTPKEECDVKYIAVLDCVLGAAFMSCPAKSFTDTDECKVTKSFLAECYENEKALDIYIQKQIKMGGQ